MWILLRQCWNTDSCAERSLLIHLIAKSAANISGLTTSATPPVCPLKTTHPISIKPGVSIISFFLETQVHSHVRSWWWEERPNKNSIDWLLSKQNQESLDRSSSELHREKWEKGGKIYVCLTALVQRTIYLSWITSISVLAKISVTCSCAAATSHRKTSFVEYPPQGVWEKGRVLFR